MAKIKVLTGITPSGTPHFGNYAGAIKPCIEQSLDEQVEPYFFLADYHALIKTRDGDRVHQSSLQIAATWLALGLDTKKAIFYRQSDVPETFQLCWILSCLTAKGLMNRAHAYKAAIQANEQKNLADLDHGINMGLFSYPVLMATDILLFNADLVPVGKDQIQHIEMTRDIASRFNHHYGEIFTLPKPKISEDTAIISGLDGRKMSKSYDNVIPIFCSEKELLKLIKKIKTNSLTPGEPKDPDGCTLFQLYSTVASDEQIEQKRAQYLQGTGWGQLKNELFEHLNEHIKPARDQYNRLLDDPTYIESTLQQGAIKARESAQKTLEKITKAVGIRPLN